MKRRFSGALSQLGVSGEEINLLPLLQMNPGPSGPYHSHYTNYTIPAHMLMQVKYNNLVQIYVIQPG